MHVLLISKLVEIEQQHQAKLYNNSPSRAQKRQQLKRYTFQTLVAEQLTGYVDLHHKKLNVCQTHSLASKLVDRTVPHSHSHSHSIPIHLTPDWLLSN